MGAAKKQSRKKWTDRKQLSNKEKRSGQTGGAQNQSKENWTDVRQLRNKEKRRDQIGGT
jgi:hypothetical protein